MAEIADGAITAKCTQCGGLIEVDEQMVTNMVALGKGLRFDHGGACPTDEPAAEPSAAPTSRRFRLQILTYELGEGEEFDAAFLGDREPTAGIGHTVEAGSHAEAVNGPMTEWLATRHLSHEGRMTSAWEKFQEQAAFADMPAPTPRS